jgi:nucleotide-binding universal stress UspA family protein
MNGVVHRRQAKEVTMTKKRLLVPVDGSRFAEKSFPYAITLAERLDAELELVTVFFDEPVMADWDIPTADLEAFHKEYIEDAAMRIRATSSIDVTTTVLGGPVGETLERHAAGRSPDLVVISTHGRGPISRAWLGSVADRLLRHIMQPILIVRPIEGEAVGMDQQPYFGQILVALDGSERAEAILPLTKEIGRAFDASYTLFRDVPPHYAATPYLPHAIAETREAIERGETDAKTYLDAATADFRAEGLSATGEVGVGVQPATAIIRHACAAGADLIALATHGRGGMPRLVLGSVADKVVRGAPMPVLVVRPG